MKNIHYLRNMFLKAADKKDKNTGKVYRYYKLCESYRIGQKTRHRTLLVLGKLESLNSEQDRKMLVDRIEQLLKGEQKLFDLDIPAHIEKLARHYYVLLKNNKWLNGIKQSEKLNDNEDCKDYQLIDVSSVKLEDVREVGSEWLCKQAIDELCIGSFLKSQGWTKKEIDIALIHLISRAVYPASEHKTAQWINENSFVSELFSINALSVKRHHLYKASKMLYKIKDSLEDFLSVKTNELFDLEDKIILSDLTNTYFEGRKVSSKLARFSKSKEHRNDAKLVALALVVNIEGFVKYSEIYHGNVSDCKVLESLILKLSSRSSFVSRKPTIVIDAGIATEENLSMLKQCGYKYVCVSRSKLKDYVAVGGRIVQLRDKRNNLIEVQWVKNKEVEEDNYLCVRSKMKGSKEWSINEYFSQRFEEELMHLGQSIHKRNGIKRYDKIIERIGRIKERYSSINKYYDIEVKSENNKVISINWKYKNVDNRLQNGVYFLRTNLNRSDEQSIWNIYNTIREIEATFRILKTDLSLRPIYHQKDEHTQAHLFLGILAYMVVNTIRYKLKRHGIHYDWQNIVRIMNTQKVGTISMQEKNGKLINKRTCSIPSSKAYEIYSATGYKSMPFYNMQLVFPEFRKS